MFYQNLDQSLIDFIQAMAVNRTTDLLTHMTGVKPDVFKSGQTATYWLDVTVIDSNKDVKAIEDGIYFMSDASRQGYLILKRKYMILALQASQRSNVPLDVNQKAHVTISFQIGKLVSAADNFVTDRILELSERIKIETVHGTYIVVP